MKKSYLFLLTLISFTINAQNFYVNKVWEKESALLSGQQNHAQTILDQGDNVLTVANKKNNSSANIFSNKINSSGIETWQTEITNFLNILGTENHGTDIKKDAQGNIYVCGANYNGLNYDYLIVKYNSSGVELWRKTYNGTGNSDDVPSSMALDASGNVFVTGASYGLTSMADFATLKLNGQNGNIVWTSRYDFSNKYDGGTQVKLDNQGNVLVCGSSAQNLQNADFVVIKYSSSNGNQLQLKRHNTPQNGYDIAIGMEIDANNNVYVVGTSNSNLVNKDIKIIAYNTNLQINWVKYIDESGLEDDVTGIVKNAYEDLLITGSTKNLQNEINILTAKISKINGNIIWKQVEQNQSGVTNAIGKGLAKDLNGNVVVVSEILKNNISFIQAVSYDTEGQKRWEYINKNVEMTNQKALDILVNGSEVILTGTKETTTGETLITIKIEEKEVIIVPDFLGEHFNTSCGLETNFGQLLNDDAQEIAKNVKFYNDRMNPAVFITDNNVVLGFQQGQDDNTIRIHRVDMDFVNSNPVKNILNLQQEEMVGIKNYYLRHNPDGFLGVKDYSRIIMADVYPNIDVQYYSGKNGMKYYINIKPNGNPNDVHLQFTGSSSIALNTDGSLDVFSEFGHITFNQPIIYQLDANNQPIQLSGQGNFILSSSNSVIFNIKDYDHNKPLFIQLEQDGAGEEHVRTDNLNWSTFYGGANYDAFKDIDTDEQGNVYFVGSSTGLGFPRTITTIFPTNSVRRIVCGSHESGGETRWSTLYGAELDLGEAIETDNQGNVYITGFSSSFGYTTGGNTNYEHHFLAFNKSGAYNLAPVSPVQGVFTYAFIIKFNQNSGERTWATLFGENSTSANYYANDISCDIEGNVYIAGGGKRAGNAPILAQGEAYEDATNGVSKSFIAKFAVNTNELEWSTLFGNDNAIIKGIQAYGHSNLLVTGATGSTNIANFPIVEEHPGADYIDNTYNGGSTDAFIARFDPGNALKYSTLFGGDLDDVSNSISVSSNGDFAIGGGTNSTGSTFPLLMVSNGYPSMNILRGEDDAFFSIFHLSTGYEIKYSTYWGRDERDVINHVQYSQSGDLYLAGSTNSVNTSVIGLQPSGFYQLDLENDPNFGYRHNAFFYVFAQSDLRPKWGTLFGGKPHVNFVDGDKGYSIAVNYNKVYLGGLANSQTDFPVREGDPGAYFQEFNGSGTSAQPDYDDYADGFLAEFDLTGTELSTSLGIDELFETIETNDYTLYPNPSSGAILLLDKSNNLNNLSEIEILDISGKSVKKITNLQHVNSNVVSFDISDLPNGFYNVILKEKAESIHLKLIKN